MILLIQFFSKLPFENPKNFSHFNVVPIASHILYYKGGSDDSFQVWVV